MPSRKRRQGTIRKGHVKMIVEHIHKKLQSKSHKKRICTTSRLLPVGTLRRKAIQSIFAGWVRHLLWQGRILTYKLAKEVVGQLRKRFQLPKCLGEDGREEIRRMHYFLKAARKRQLGVAKPQPKKMSAMDCADTVPMEWQD